MTVTLHGEPMSLTVVIRIDGFVSVCPVIQTHELASALGTQHTEPPKKDF